MIASLKNMQKNTSTMQRSTDRDVFIHVCVSIWPVATEKQVLLIQVPERDVH